MAVLYLNKLFNISVLLALIHTTSALAASDGSLGATSEGTFTASVTVEKQYIISGLENYLFPTTAPGLSGAIIGPENNLCIGTNAISGMASMDVTGIGGVFLLHGTSEDLPYLVSVYDGATLHDVDPGDPIDIIASTLDDCEGTVENHTIQLTVPGGTASVSEGSYTDTITITITEATSD